MCVVAAEHLAPAVRLGSVDVILADPHYWGGFRENRRMMAVCSAFGLSVGMHSDNDLGLANAARLHLAAASPELVHAVDWHGPEHACDLLTEPLRVVDGALRGADRAGPGRRARPRARRPLPRLLTVASAPSTASATASSASSANGRPTSCTPIGSGPRRSGTTTAGCPVRLAM